MDIGLPENHGAVIITLHYHNIVSLLHKEIRSMGVMCLIGLQRLLFRALCSQMGSRGSFECGTHLSMPRVEFIVQSWIC